MIGGISFSCCNDQIAPCRKVIGGYLILTALVLGILATLFAAGILHSNITTLSFCAAAGTLFLILGMGCLGLIHKTPLAPRNANGNEQPPANERRILDEALVRAHQEAEQKQTNREVFLHTSLVGEQPVAFELIPEEQILPNEILTEILFHFSPHDMFNCALVSKGWYNNVVKHPVVELSNIYSTFKR